MSLDWCAYPNKVVSNISYLDFVAQMDGFREDICIIWRFVHRHDVVRLSAILHRLGSWLVQTLALC